MARVYGEVLLNTLFARLLVLNSKPFGGEVH